MIECDSNTGAMTLVAPLIVPDVMDDIVHDIDYDIGPRYTMS